MTVGRVLDRTVLDANVIFSAAYRATTDLRRLWSLPDLALITSHYAIIEAQSNLPLTRYADLQFLLQAVTLVPTPVLVSWKQPGRSAERAVPVTRMAFHDSEVVHRASAGYAELEVTTRVLFVPFEPAFGLLHELVDDLEIPD